MKPDLAQESLGKTFIKIIRMMQNIEFTSSPDKTTNTPEKLGATIEKMAHDLPTICLWVSNGCSALLLEHRNRVFGMTHSFTNIKHVLLQKMIQIILVRKLSLRLIRERFVTKITTYFHIP